METLGSTARVGKQRSLEDVHRSVDVDQASFWRRLLAFSGPAYMVSVGYMDPGNWATDIAGGSHFGYSLLWVLVVSNLMALLLQTLSARLGIVAGRDLAQACRDLYPKGVRIALWVFCEVAIAACDLAEVIGTVIGLHLLFGLPFAWGLLVTVFDTFLLLAIQRLGIRRMEAFIIILVFTIGACFVIEILWARPEWHLVASGLFPSFSSKPPFVFSSLEALYIAIGILGATVMPHNLYLHSALVQSRSHERTEQGMAQACRFNLIDSFCALNAAFVVNASILILAGAAFATHGQIVEGIEDAYRLLPQFLGPSLAATLFAVALLCSGQSSTLTGTLAGQIVMEGFVSLRIRPWLRRFVTRSIAILPAAITIFVLGQEKIGSLLVLSQVILSLQLPFAIVPLLTLTSDKTRMGPFANALWVRVFGWVTALLIITLNAYLAISSIVLWRGQLLASGQSSLWVDLTVVPLVIGCGALLLWMIFEPLMRRSKSAKISGRASGGDVISAITEPAFKRVAVAVENVPEDAIAISHALAIAKSHCSELVIVHVVDGVGAQWYGAETDDEESQNDRKYVNDLTTAIMKNGASARGIVCYGTPVEELIKVIRTERIDVIVLRAHGHKMIGDYAFGHTIDTLRHGVRIPVFVVRD